MARFGHATTPKLMILPWLLPFIICPICALHTIRSWRFARLCQHEAQGPAYQCMAENQQQRWCYRWDSVPLAPCWWECMGEWWWECMGEWCYQPEDDSYFAILTKSGPTAWVLWGLDDQDPIVLIMSQACKTLTIDPRIIWNGWQHIHGLWFLCNNMYIIEDGLVVIQ